MKKILLLSVMLPVGGCMVDAGGDDSLGSVEQGVAVTWQNAVGVSAVGNDLTKTGAIGGWNAGASSVESIGSNGYVEFTTAEATKAKMAGLGNGDSGTGYADIEYAVYLKSTGKYGVYEAGVLRNGNIGVYAAGDVFRVENTDGVVTYSKNGSVFYTSTVPATGPFVADTSLSQTGATINDVNIVSTTITWQNAVRVSISLNNDLTKTAGVGGWNGGAASIETISGNGYVEFTTAEATTAKMCGLGGPDTGAGYADIEYAIHLRADGKAQVRENGVTHGALRPYVAGDLFRVTNTGGTVTYSQNGTVFYTSTVAPVTVLGVDTSLLTTGATITGVHLVAAP